MNNTTEQRYLVFLKAEFLCDAMGYIAGAVPHGADASLFDDECDGNWRSVSGPVLLMDKTCADMDELKSSILDNYPASTSRCWTSWPSRDKSNLRSVLWNALQRFRTERRKIIF